MASVGVPRRPDPAAAWGRRADPRLGEAGLGKLVRFITRPRSGKASPDVAGRGEIVLFTGVRYERDGAPAPQKPVGSTGGVKRRRG